jgi:hypothetical protein
MYLEVQYKGASDMATPKRKWVSNLPSLEELRQQARSKGIDPTPFGRSKALLTKALQERPAPRMMKTAPAIGPVVIITPDDPDKSIN